MRNLPCTARSSTTAAPGNISLISTRVATRSTNRRVARQIHPLLLFLPMANEIGALAHRARRWVAGATGADAPAYKSRFLNTSIYICAFIPTNTCFKHGFNRARPTRLGDEPKFDGAPRQDRTAGLGLRRASLYPTELWAHEYFRLMMSIQETEAFSQSVCTYYLLRNTYAHPGHPKMVT